MHTQQNHPRSSARKDGNVEELLTPSEVAEMLGVKLRTLEAWRYRGGGPQYIRISHRCIRYRPEDVRNWLKARVRASTSHVS